MSYPKISIALCTNNGARFLPELLKSLSNQVVMPGELVVCDDASSDSTISCINKYTADSKYPVKVIENSRRLGVLANYSRAISSCKGDYVALCDQDDIWFPEKLELTMQKMKEAESIYSTNLPLLVHTDLSVIDYSGKIIAKSYFKKRKLQENIEYPLKVLLTQNFVTGCTVLINRSLIKAALPIPGNAVYHDWWLALIAASTGKIIFEPSATLYYRQHDENVIGPKGFYTWENITRLTKLKTLEQELGSAIKQAEALKERLIDLSDQNQVVDFLEDYLKAVYSGGGTAAKKALKYGIRMIGLIRNTVFILLLLKGGYKSYL